MVSINRRLICVRWLLHRAVLPSFLITCLAAHAATAGNSAVSPDRDPGKVAVPKVIDLTRSQATKALAKVDLDVGRVHHEWSEKIAAGRVVYQSPRAGSRVRRDSRVDLVISKGSHQQEVSVPNVVGQSQAAASAAITAAKLIVGGVTQQASSTVAAGLVISETPAAGTKVATDSAVTLIVSSGVVTATALEAEHALTQTGLAIGLASTVLQSQVQMLLKLLVNSSGCNQLEGGGSVLQGPAAGKVTVYYDNACTQPYITATPNLTQSPVTGGTLITVSESADYQGPSGISLGALTLNESAFAPSDGTSNLEVYGLGVFKPVSGARTPVQLGLYCSIPGTGGTTTVTLQCAGGIAQDFPALSAAIGAVTPLTLTLTNTGKSTSGILTYSVSFVGGGRAVLGSPGSLTLTNPSPTSLVISGGTDFETTTVSGSAPAFALFPPPPTGWSITDAANDQTLQISVASNTARNLTLTLARASTGAPLATGSLDQSGTGSMTFSDGSSVAVTSWTLAD